MALAYPVERRYRITTADNGNFPTLGEASDSDVGVWHVAFYPDEDFVGTLEVVGRSQGKGPHDDAAGFGHVAFRRVQLAGMASDYELVQTSAVVVPLNTDFLILVPAAGLSIALAVLCTQGAGTLYSKPLAGSGMP